MADLIMVFTGDGAVVKILQRILVNVEGDEKWRMRMELSPEIIKTYKSELTTTEIEENEAIRSYPKNKIRPSTISRELFLCDMFFNEQELSSSEEIEFWRTKAETLIREITRIKALLVETEYKLTKKELREDEMFDKFVGKMEKVGKAVRKDVDVRKRK
jgi:hypothetical protein